MTALAPLPTHRDAPSASTVVIVHQSYDHIAFLSALSSLLAAAPEELRLLNLHDRRIDEGSQVLDDGLADFDAVDFLGSEGDDDDLGGEDFGP